MNPKVNPNAKTKTVHTNVLIDNITTFDKLYPSARTRFINNAIALAVSDRNFFDSIFFNAITSVNK